MSRPLSPEESKTATGNISGILCIAGIGTVGIVCGVYGLICWLGGVCS